MLESVPQFDRANQVMIMKYDFCLFELWVSRIIIIIILIGKVMGLEPTTSLSNVDRKSLRRNTIKYQDLWARFDVGLSWHIS